MSDHKPVRLSKSVKNDDRERGIQDFRMAKDAQKYIEYGADNLLPQRLLDYANLSPTHGAILKKKIGYTVGNGVRIQEPELQWLEDALANGEGLLSVAEQMAIDYWTFGGFALQMLWDGAGNNVGDFVATPWQQLRYGLNSNVNSKDLYEWGVWFSPFWEYQKNAQFKPVYYQLYNPDIPSTKPVFCYFRKRTLGANYYPVPNYYSALVPIKNEVDIWEAQESFIRNMFLPSGVLTTPGNLTEDEAQELDKQIEDTFKGRENVGKILAVTANGDAVAKWEPLAQNLADKDITPITSPAIQAIITAHELPSPVLAGLPAGPSIGSSGPEMIVAMNQFFDSQIAPAQKCIKDWLEYAIAQMGYRATIVIESNRPTYDLLTNGGRA